MVAHRAPEGDLGVLLLKVRLVQQPLQLLPVLVGLLLILDQAGVYGVAEHAASDHGGAGMLAGERERPGPVDVCQPAWWRTPPRMA
ncbi:MAG: hypothetical protein ACR2NA_06955 [Solirubrobacterales bacterium]